MATLLAAFCKEFETQVVKDLETTNGQFLNQPGAETTPKSARAKVSKKDGNLTARSTISPSPLKSARKENNTPTIAQ